MDIVICDRPNVLRRARRDRPSRAAGQVLLRIRRVGVCGTDYHIFRGTQPYLSYPRVMGHELAAEVVEIDAGSNLRIGQNVAVLPYLSCGACVACRRGKSNCCARLSVLGVHVDGGMVEWLAVDEAFAVPADGLDPDQTAMVEFLAIGLHAVRRGAVAAGQQVLVAGAGPIGMAVGLFCAAIGAKVTVLDGNAARARFCVERLGCAAMETPDGAVADRLAARTGNDFFDVVFDATGNADAMRTGFAYVAHGGTYVLVSIVGASITFDDPEFHKREMTLLGSRNATRADFVDVIDAIRAGKVPTAALHTHGASLNDLPDVFASWMDPAANVIKAIVTV